MKKLLIINCSDPLMWYFDKVDESVDFVREESDCYISREPAGWINIVKKEDAKIIEA